MVLVRVQRISSYTDPETHRQGKIIELVEVRKTAGFMAVAGGDESAVMQKMLQSALLQMQSMGIMPPFREMAFPKLTLYLTEEEYDLLNVRLEVNEVYELSFKEGSISFNRPYVSQ